VLISHVQKYMEMYKFSQFLSEKPDKSVKNLQIFQKVTETSMKYDNYGI